MNKIAIALSFALALGAASTASAEYDPWIQPNDGYAATDSSPAVSGFHAFASSVEAPLPDPRFDDPASGALAW